MLLGIGRIKNQFLRWLLISVAIFFILLVISLPSFLIFEKLYKNRIYPGINLGDINLGGQTKEEAKKLLSQQINRINQDGLKFKYSNQPITIMPTISSFEGDLAYQIISFDVDQTVNKIFAFGRSDNFFLNLEDKIAALVFKKPAQAIYRFNETEIKKILKSNYEKFENPAKNAELIATSTPTNQEKIIFEINKEKLGKIIDYEKGIEGLKINLNGLNISPIKLFSKTDYPFIYRDECLNVGSQAQKILLSSPLTLTYKEKRWVIDKKQIGGWLALEREKSSQRPSGQNQSEKSKIIVTLNSEKLDKFLKETIAPKIEKEPIDARFRIKNGRVIEFRGSQDGLKLEINDNINKIKSEFIKNKNNAIKLTTKEIKSAVNTGEINDLGIKEIIGTGYSNFAGSPTNRRHNIKVGANSINGLLIKPKEEFSLNKALGKIEAETGYLPELVIKGNETIPEYGGGLCQIGTTMFRTALASGLPITARQNHSYRVSYYEPAGTDATIYGPWPDVRFVNDTTNHILIQTRIEGDNLYFDSWGTKDGRLVEKTDPIIYNIVKPGPTKIIETLDLPVGEKKCTERAHNGADAYFDYKVIYPALTATSTPEVKERRFSSHYIPWQEVCLIGVEKLSEEEEIKDETSEEEKDENNPHNETKE